MIVSEIISESLDNLTIKNEHHDSYRSGYSGTLYAMLSNETIGYLKYHIYRDVPSINMIFVKPEYRRSKVGMRLLKALQNLSPNEEIDWGLTTPDGSKLRTSIDYIRKPNPEIIHKILKLKGVTSKLNQMNYKLEQLQKSDIELARRYVKTVSDRWNKLNDMKYKLENDLYLSKPEYSKLIPENNEILDEIVSITGRDEQIENSNYLFKRSFKRPTPEFSNGVSYGYTFKEDDNIEHYALLDGSDVIALLRLENERLSGKYQILSTQVEVSLRGLGLMRYLFNRALDKHNEIYSDTHQSKEAKHFWNMLIKYPEPRYSIYIYDTENDELHDTTEYIGDLDKTIWNQEENPILVCIKRSYTPRQLKVNEHNNNIRKKVNRDDWSLWYSKSDRKGYENP